MITSFKLQINRYVILIIFFLTYCYHLSSAQDIDSKPNTLCSEPDRKELVELYEKYELDVQFAKDFCDRFAPGVQPRKRPKIVERAPAPSNTAVATEKEIPSAEIILEAPEILDLAEDKSTQDKLNSTVEARTKEQQADENYFEPASSVLESTTEEELTGSIAVETPTEIEPTPVLTEKDSLIILVGIGEFKSQYSESGSSVNLSGVQYEAALKFPISSSTQWGLNQSLRRQSGTLNTASYSRDLSWEQWQLGASWEMLTEITKQLQLSIGLSGGWEENRLNYSFEDPGIVYYSDVYQNGQTWWGFGFGLGWQFLQNYRIGAGMQIQPVTNQFTTEEDTTGRLANRMSTLLTLEYLTN